MRLIDADIFAEISKNFIPEVIEDTFDEGYIACLKAVDLTPTVEAIPKEWIKQWQNRHEWEYESFFRMVEGVPKHAIECMLDDWEKENE